MRCNHATGPARRLVPPAAALAAVLAAALAAPPAADARTPPGSFADLAERLLPSVVNISTTQPAEPRGGPPEAEPGGEDAPRSPTFEFFRRFFERDMQPGRPQRPEASAGSGFVIDAKGLIVTNHHVVEGAEEIAVTFSDNSKLPATVVGRDARTDLALLRVEPKARLSPVSFGDSNRTRVGDWVIAIGNPFGFGGSVTAGIVSALGRDIRSGPYDDYIQTDAAINRGNSGGPMFNLRGEVIGVTTAIFSPTGASLGIGFAIPANLARSVIDQLREHGRARRGYLGVRIQSVTDELAGPLGLDAAAGALVAGLADDGPAAAAGIEVGDVILRFDGRKIDEMRRLPRIVGDTPVGRSVLVEVWRKGARKTIRVMLGELPEEEPRTAARPAPAPEKDTAEVAALGLELSALTPELRRRFDLEADADGVVVTEVAPGSPADEKRIRAGDIVRRIGPAQTEVTRPDEVAGAIEDARRNSAGAVLVLMERAGSRRFVALRIPEG